MDRVYRSQNLSAAGGNQRIKTYDRSPTLHLSCLLYDALSTYIYLKFLQKVFLQSDELWKDYSEK